MVWRVSCLRHCHYDSCSPQTKSVKGGGALKATSWFGPLASVTEVMLTCGKKLFFHLSIAEVELSQVQDEGVGPFLEVASMERLPVVQAK